MLSNNDVLKMSVEAHSGGKNTVLFDDLGKPSIMVRIPKFKIKDVLTGGSDAWHPMFLVNGVVKDEIFISQFENVLESDRAYSLPARDPQAYVDFDTAKAACERKGRGWHLMSNAEYAGIAMWCKANGFTPHGNNWCGCDMDHKWEKGTQSYDWLLSYNWNTMANSFDGTNYHHTGRVLTGSGPATWYHDGTLAGIDGLAGNMWKWVCGFRIFDGELQIIPDNNSAMGVDESRASTQWKAIMPDGRLVAPKTAGTLKYDSIAVGGTTDVHHGALQLSNVVSHPHYTGGSTDEYIGYGSNNFESFTVKAGVAVPEIVKVLGLYPYDTEVDGHFKDGFWCRNYGERLPLRGGHWTDGAGAGVFALFVNHARGLLTSDVGCRSAFVF